MSNIKLYLIKYEIPTLNRLGIATVAASSPKQAQDYLQAQGKYNGYKYDMNYPIIVHTTDTWTAAAIIAEIDNPIGEKGDRGPQGPKGEKGEKGDPATPSGDPMHYAYEDVGAVWNANTGYWEMYDMKDVTTEQMRRSYNFGHINTQNIAPLGMYGSSSPSNIRFNLPRTGENAAYFSFFASFASGNYNIEVINLMATYVMSEDKKERSQIVNARYAFYYCEKLRRVLSLIDFSTATDVAGMFNRCYKLEQINCYGLKQDISFADSPLLSKESLLYMINNCASDVSFTITLHPDVYDRCYTEWLEDVDSALGRAESEKITNITLASA